MWMRPVIRDLLDTLAAAAPDASGALARIRPELLDLLAALLRPDDEADEAKLRGELGVMIDGLLAERAPAGRLIRLPARAAA